MKVEFVSDATVMVEGKSETLFSTGDIQELNGASAERWIRRGVAVQATNKPASKKTAKKKAKK